MVSGVIMNDQATTSRRSLIERCYRDDRPAARVLTLVVGALGVAVALWSGRIAPDCPDLHPVLSFRPTDVPGGLGNGSCQVTEAQLRGTYLADLLGTVIYGPALAALTLVWWRFGWRSRGQSSLRVARIAALVPIGGALVDAIENLVVLVGVDVDGAGLPDPARWAAVVLAVVGTTKWLFVGLWLLTIGLTLYGAVRFRRIALVDFDAPDRRSGSVPSDPPAAPAGTAVCLSGGGIRSASFAWGALSTLESSGELAAADRMYSVSGGGYAATAYTARAGFGTEHFFTVDHGPVTEATDTPYRFVRRWRKYLDHVRGGVLRGLVRVVGNLCMNLSVIVGGLFVLAVPIGLLARGRFGAVDAQADRDDFPWVEFRDGALLPTIGLLVVAAALVVLSLVLLQPRRRVALRAAGGVVALAGLAFVVTVGLPWVAIILDDILERDWTSVLPGVVTWLIGGALAWLRSRVGKKASRLGGVVTALAMVYALVLVTHWTIQSEGAWGYWAVLVAAVIVYLVVVDTYGVQWWSLHPLYRDRLAATFMIARCEPRTGRLLRRRAAAATPPGDTPDDGPRSVRSQRWQEWQRWTDLDDAGPEHVICAAAHRGHREVTGLTAVSFRYSTEGVEYFEPHLVGEGEVEVRRTGRDAAWFDRAVGATRRAPWGTERWLRPSVRSSLITSAAVSGAAFDSALGRKSQGSTDSLLAMLNLRLGVWLPNPEFEVHDQREFPKAGLRYLFHEVFGYYDIDDPFVHVTDGGHWENLGLTEALRDRHRRVIVVDATGGRVEAARPGEVAPGFDAFFEAQDLARIELHVEVRLDVDVMRPDPRTGRALTNWALGTIVYHYDAEHDWRRCDATSCPHGDLVYVRSVVSDRTPEAVLAHANVDRVFPAYATTDQFLTDHEFTSLVRLGETAMEGALRGYEAEQVARAAHARRFE